MEGDIQEGSINGLSRLLSQVLGMEEEEREDIQKSNAIAQKKKVELREDVGHMEEAFSALCNGLVELSSMPKYQQEEELEEETHPEGQPVDKGGLPMWLLGLLVCCKLEERDEASIRLQVNSYGIQKYPNFFSLAVCNPHSTGTGGSSTISDCNPEQRQGGS